MDRSEFRTKSMIHTFLETRFPGNPKAVHHFGSILEKYAQSGLAPPNLVDELRSGDEHKLWAHVWEGLLYDHYSLLGFKFKEGVVRKRGQSGPDFGIIHGEKTIWVEAIVPKPEGIPSEHLCPPTGIVEAREIPHKEKLLRWTSSIKNKNEKMGEYVRNGIISKDDSVVIAVNSCRLQDFAFDDLGVSQLPYAVEATFPVGPLGIPLNRQGQQDGPPQNLWRGTVRKGNGSDIPTDSFLKPEFSGVSAVLGTHQRDLWNGPLVLSLVHNPLAKNPIPTRILGATREYVGELQGDEFILRRL